MDKKLGFQEIKKAYKEHYDSILKKGKLPMWSTDKGFWGYADPEVCFEIFKKLKLDKCEHLLDLGSGDGLIVLIASLFTEATGIEFDPLLIEKSLEMMDKLGMRAEMKCEDFLKEDFSKYDIIFINPDNDFLRCGLDTKLKKELKPGAKLLVYNIVHQPNTLKKGKTYWHKDIPITVYTKA